jgi:hypothetical protein
VYDFYFPVAIEVTAYTRPVSINARNFSSYICHQTLQSQDTVKSDVQKEPKQWSMATEERTK